MELQEILNDTIVSINSIIEQFSSQANASNVGQLYPLIEKSALLAKAVNEQPNNDFDLAELNDKLGMILQAMENNDITLITDIMSFELKPLLTDWAENISYL
jgi:hypothetical protein